jgi:hypothetical protein
MQASMLPAGFEPEIPISERPHTYVLDSAATGISFFCLTMRDKPAQEHQLKMNENTVKRSYKFGVKRHLVDNMLHISTRNGHHEVSYKRKNINVNSVGFLINITLCERSHYVLFFFFNSLGSVHPRSIYK